MSEYVTPPLRPGYVRLRPGDKLDRGQSIRVAEAVAILEAKLAALEAGVRPEDLKLYEWVVDVEMVDADDNLAIEGDGGS